MDEALWEGRYVPHWETEKAVYRDRPLQRGKEMLLLGSLYPEKNVEAEAQLRIVPVDAVE